MRAGKLLTGGARRPKCWLLVGIVACAAMLPGSAFGQRPFRLHDPFYRSETARRAFFDKYAITAEVAYRSAASIQESGLPVSNSDPLVFSFRFDYQLADELDLGAIVDAEGGSAGRTVSLSWIVLKYYRYLESSDYAVRLAVDPYSDARVGFPQVDLAFLYTAMLSSNLASDFALGVRRVNIGYLDIIPGERPGPDDPLIVNPSRPSLLLTRALGTELHVMMSYNVLFDPAGSNMFVTLLGEGGRYDLVETIQESGPAGGGLSGLRQVSAESEGEERSVNYRGGVVWIQAGLEFCRPSYQVSPFVSLPLQQWTVASTDESYPEARLHFGVRLMLR